jgi:hypothetical protein
MDKGNFESIVYSQKVIEFVAVANEYCLLVEKVTQYPAQQLVDITRKILPLLYFKASVLPDIVEILQEDLEKYVSELDYNLLLQKWSQKLGGYDTYFEVFDPEIQFGTETVTASISENILDIYQDVKDFITSYSIGDEDIMNDALAECMAHFRDFWGQRLVNVLRALHQLSVANVSWGEESGATVQEKSKHNPSNWVERYFDLNDE